MASSIKIGDHFTDIRWPGAVFVCKLLGHVDVLDTAELWHGPGGIARVRVTIRPIKTRKVKPSELRAWHRKHAYWFVRGPFAESGLTEVGWTNSREEYCFRGDTEAAAILALRKALRSEGVKL